MSNLALYVHVPFCTRKCAYCDFNAYSGLGALADSVVSSILREIETAAERGRPVPTCFFGGGTPTYLRGSQLTEILAALQAAFAFDADAEISSEANPSTVDASKFAAMREAGFNRISIGVQAFDDRLLKQLDREHSAAEAESAIREARRAGFENLSIDLMFGLPGQSRADWDTTLDSAIGFGTEHISVYSLTLEPGTRFERLHKGGKLSLPTEEDELWMFERAIERLTEAGFDHYEVSNFARPSFRARHNLVYWHNEEYLGFGPGAVSYVGGQRWTKEKFPARYVAKVNSGDDLTVESESLDEEGNLAETLMLGLRLREGIGLQPLAERFGNPAMERMAVTLADLERQGLVMFDEGRVRLSHEGLLLANDVFLRLLPD